LSKENEKKIGIMTIHFVYNYGAMLQAFALNEYLRNEGYDSYIIDYRPRFLNKNYRISYLSFFQNPILQTKMIIKKILFPKKYVNFENFLKEQLHCTSSIGWKSKSEKCGIVIAGSDQIWNMNVVNYDATYLLDFANESQKKISYASSFGSHQIDETWNEVVRDNLRSFDAIAVREETGAEIVNGLHIDRTPEVVVDPVFLLSSSKWSTLGQKPSGFSYSDYILYYMLEENQNMIDSLYKLKRMTNLKIISVHPTLIKNRIGDISLNNIGPREFVWLIENANYVVSNSFHGTCFSVLFGKKMIIGEHSKTNTRMENLIKNLKIPFLELEKNNERIKYLEPGNESRERLQDYIGKSKEFLKRLL